MKIDDSIYLNQMELEFSNINEFHSKLEQKAYNDWNYWCGNVN